jgi:hypothetical protein
LKVILQAAVFRKSAVNTVALLSEIGHLSRERMALRLKRNLLEVLDAAAITVQLVLATRPLHTGVEGAARWRSILTPCASRGTDSIAPPATNRIAFTPSVEHLFCWRQTPLVRLY